MLDEFINRAYRRTRLVSRLIFDPRSLDLRSSINVALRWIVRRVYRVASTLRGLSEKRFL